MADWEAAPETGDPGEPAQAGHRDRRRERRERRERDGDRMGALGCLGGAGLGVVGTAIAGVILFSLLASSLDGCAFDLDFGDINLGDPGDGTESAELDVLVAPATDLAHHQEVTVGSTAFRPYAVVGVAVCLAEAASVDLGVAACDEAQGERFAADDEGRVRATYEVPRVISVDGATIDCGTSAGRCLLVAADASDYDLSGGQPISFDAGERAPLLERPGQRPQTDLLPITASPEGPVAPGTTVTLAATGFQPGEPLLVAWCTAAFAEDGPTTCDPRDSSDAFGSIALRTVPADPALVADEAGAVTVEVEARASITPFIDPDAEEGSTPDEGAGEVDCRGEPGTCWFVIAAAADTKRSAVLPYDLVAR